MSPTPIVYDAGALLAAERHDRRFGIIHKRALVASRHIIVPAPVLAQAWRGGTRQAGLARTLQGCVVLPTDEETARRAGVLLERSGTSDAVDAIVVATAHRLGALVVTSDPNDLHKIADAVSDPLNLIVV